ncbi:HAD family phosphatase [Dactylosporangium sp. AC04546]|uniref:HAD family hydrolase n=1 Tax=Dactylosporangium sp. AC04546 TaxID=2862460 RepID=UPI001EDD6C23|nr:HAD family phosphatase [Dactylosporangium sp. AC04546]WVK86174.1 HAD family phosphatase [Dactylosporangium sp. AC04546]
MPDVILFDLFGVIARNQSQAAKRTLAETADAPVTAFWDAYWRLRAPYDLGQITGAEYWRWVATALGTTFDGDRVTALIAADVASWSAVDDAMVALIERVNAAGTHLALLSNVPEELASHYEQHHARWLRHFDLIAFSCRIGRAKPDADAFLWCCRALGLAPDRLLFIDDRAENINAADRLGLHTHLFTDPAAAARAIDATTAGRRSSRLASPVPPLHQTDRRLSSWPVSE